MYGLPHTQRMPKITSIQIGYKCLVRDRIRESGAYSVTASLCQHMLISYSTNELCSLPANEKALKRRYLVYSV